MTDLVLAEVYVGVSKVQKSLGNRQFFLCQKTGVSRAVKSSLQILHTSLHISGAIRQIRQVVVNLIKQACLCDELCRQLGLQHLFTASKDFLSNWKLLAVDKNLGRFTTLTNVASENIIDFLIGAIRAEVFHLLHEFCTKCISLNKGIPFLILTTVWSIFLVSGSRLVFMLLSLSDCD